MIDYPSRCWHKFVELVSGEWMLSVRPSGNGGSIILARTIFVSTVLFLAAMGLGELFDTTKTWEPNWRAFTAAVDRNLEWFGAIFAATYAALYTRFSQQWHYLAGVYNQIKAAQARDPQQAFSPPITEWMAGYIEDAADLHLAPKPSIAAVIVAWGAREEVAAKFIEHAPGSEVRLRGLMAIARNATARHGKRLERKAKKWVKRYPTAVAEQQSGTLPKSESESS